MNYSKNIIFSIIMVLFFLNGCALNEDNAGSQNDNNESIDTNELIITYSNWTIDADIGEIREVCMKKNDCESCYNEYRNILPYEDRCCTNDFCLSSCGPYPKIEKENAEADFILCICEKTNNNTQVITELLQKLDMDMSRFENNNLCKPRKSYAI